MLLAFLEVVCTEWLVVKPLVLKLAGGEEKGRDHARHSVVVPMELLPQIFLQVFSKLREAQKDHLEGTKDVLS